MTAIRQCAFVSIASADTRLDWDLEIRKRYVQALASETGEFPDPESIHNRMEPMCYEEGITSGASDGTAAFMAVATETFIKEVLSGIFGRTRSNGPNYVMTTAYKRQLQREEDALLRGDIQKNVNSLLPVEQAAASQRRPLGMDDVRLALEMGDMYLGQMPLTSERIVGGYLEGGEDASAGQLEGAMDGELPNGVNGVNGTHGVDGAQDGDASMDDTDWGWEGGGAVDRQALGSLLDECLSIG